MAGIQMNSLQDAEMRQLLARWVESVRTPIPTVWPAADGQ